jgi:hypothetical protein
MTRRKQIAVIGGAMLLAGAVGGGVALLQADGATPVGAAMPTVTVTPPPAEWASPAPATGTSTSSRPQNETLFLQVLRDQGHVEYQAQEVLLLAQGDLYCRSLSDGLSREQIFRSAGLPGSPARQKAEAVFFTAVVSLCPEQSGKATA